MHWCVGSVLDKWMADWLAGWLDGWLDGRKARHMLSGWVNALVCAVGSSLDRWMSD